jgi:hypothetical protein
MANQTHAGAPPLAALRSALNLTDAEWEAVQQQGFVSRKSRGRRGTVYLLRFRLHGKQVARYLGTNQQQVQAIQQALKTCQRPRALRRRLRNRIRQMRSLLSAIKPQIEPYAQATGHYFHGHTLRRRRQQLPRSREPAAT